MARHHVPGGVLVVVRGGRVFFARGFGYADLERRIPVDPERTIFRVASVSKVFTATAAMQLVDQGRVTLHEDLNRYLKRLRIEPTFAEPVTLFHLLTHTAGFDDRNIARKSPTLAGVEHLGTYLVRRMPDRIWPPGRFLCYSNHGMALAGDLVEEVSGLPFDRYMRQNVFDPLSMTRSTFALRSVAPSDVAVGYDDSDPPRPEPAVYVQTTPASMLTTTAMDVARFMIAHLEDGHVAARAILSERSLREMHRRQFTQDPLLPGIALGFWERFQNGERALWHDGDLAGFASMLYLLPDQDTGFFLAFNGEGGHPAREEILAALLDRYFPDRRPIPRSNRLAHAEREGRRCAGVYVFNRYGHRSLEKLASLVNQLRVRSDAEGSLTFRGERYVPISPTVFQRMDGSDYLVFRADARGRIRHMFAGERIARVYERIPWCATSSAQLGLLGLCALLFAWTIGASSWASLRRRLGRRAPRTGLERRTELAAVILAALNLVFLVGLAVYMTQLAPQLEYRIPLPFVILLTIPLIGTGITVALVFLSVKMWMGPAVGLGTRLRYSILSVGALAFVAWLAQWNLLGYRF